MPCVYMWYLCVLCPCSSYMYTVHGCSLCEYECSVHMCAVYTTVCCACMQCAWMCNANVACMCAVNLYVGVLSTGLMYVSTQARTLSK